MTPAQRLAFISQRCGIGKVRHLRTQGLWVQEARLTGRLAYRKVLGTKNPADVLTKHVPAELLQRHLETLCTEVRGGRAEAAPELNSLESIAWRSQAMMSTESFWEDLASPVVDAWASAMRGVAG